MTEPQIARLRDGSRVEIRPIHPDDRDALREGFERLSPESRYRRFFGAMTELKERDLDYLTQIDHHNHEAIVAGDPDTGAGIGIARYVRTGPSVAEPAVVVVDDWQGRGVGTLLIRELAKRGREEGVTRFEAPVLANNIDAIHVLEHLGETTKEPTGHEVQLTIDLPAGQEVPGWQDLLRQFALGALEPARTVLERLRWPGVP